MFQLEPWLETIADARIRDFFMRSLQEDKEHGASAVASWLRLPMLLYGLVTTGVDIADISAAVEQASSARSVFNLSPVEEMMRNPEVFDPEKVRASGIALRISIVGLESGQLRHVTETGEVLGTGGKKVDLIDAAIASASIPLAFPPRYLAGEYYVDGGVRETLPLRAALDAGATEIFAITATQSTSPVESFEHATLVRIGMRAVGEIMVDEITEGDVRRLGLGGSSARVTLIRPTLQVHDIITIDCGRIDISIAYGYMRAADHLHPSSADRQICMDLSDRITSLRLECWKQERAFMRGTPRRIMTSSDRATLLTIRSLKMRIYAAVQQRHAREAPVPAGAEAWWQQWEKHDWDPPAESPWDRVFTTFGPVPAESSPPAL